ncbi:hypothetical protein AI19_07030 [Thalassolituus oleivorans 4BN06-13]|jgi:predicted RNA binding protein YcfA (HicA-like mRNA interferase family)|nr:hypothetical protein [Thalassolituus oleivorans 4BN06-13]
MTMQISSNKDINKRANQLLKLGWVLVRKKKHSILKAPCGEMLTVSSSPSDARAYKNFISDIKKRNLPNDT